MAAGCLYCARDLWVRGTLRAWVLVALMNLAMIAIHAPAPAAHHHGGGVTTAAPAPHSTVMNLATTLAAVEVVAAAAVLYSRTRPGDVGLGASQRLRRVVAEKEALQARRDCRRHRGRHRRAAVLQARRANL
jgi:hypothetical protein